VMGEMITGSPMVGGTSQIEVLMAHASEEPLPLPEAVIASAFGKVIQRAVAKGLDVRYRNAVQMHAEVTAVLARLEAGGGAPQDEEDTLAATLAFGSDAALEATLLDPEPPPPHAPPPTGPPPTHH